MCLPEKISGFNKYAITHGSCKGAPSVPYLSLSKRSKNAVISATNVPHLVFNLLNLSILSGVVKALCVTSKGIITKSSPKLNT